MSDGGHIFISYARKDGQAQAERLEVALQARGYKTWRDTRGIDPAKDFTAEIERAIKAAELVVTCITPDTERDESFVRREIQYALVVKKRVIVARMAEVAPPIHVVNNTWVEFWRDWDKGFEHLLTVLNTPVENYSAPALPPEAADPFRPYVQALYERTVDFLDRAVIRLIDLTSEETPEAVNAPPRQPSMIDLFFTAHGIGEEKPAKRLPFPTFAEAFEAYEGRGLLLGKPGAGKTITLMAFARDAAAKRLSDPSAPLPLLGLISSWDAEKQTPLDDWLAAGMGGVKPEDVKREVEGGKGLLLLDGLDELGGEREENANPLPTSPKYRGRVKYDPRKRFMEQLPANNHILVTCRVKDYEEIGQKMALKGAVTLRPLDEGQMQTYLAEQPELWAAVQADEKLKEMLTTPLLLSFFAFAYRDDLDRKERQQLATFSDSPGDLRDKIFETYVRKRYEHEERKYAARGEAVPFTVEEIYEVLGQAAMMSANKYYKDNNIPGFEFRVPNSSHKDATFLDFVSRIHLINLAGEVEIQWTKRKREIRRFYRFLHILLRDYFAFPNAMRLSSSEDINVRRTAISALGQIGDVRATESLMNSYNHIDEWIRHETISSLGELKTTKAIIPIISTLKDKNIHLVWDASVDALVKIGEQAVEELIIALSEEHKGVRYGAIQALGEIGDNRAIKPLITLLNHNEFGTRCFAAIALGEIGTKRSVKPLIAKLSDSNIYVRCAASDALGKIADKRAIDPLLDTLRKNSRSWKVWESVGEAIISIDQEYIFQPFLTKLQNAKTTPNMISIIMRLLGLIRDKRNIPAYIELLKDKRVPSLTPYSRPIYETAIRNLIRIGEPAVKPLLKVINSGVEDSAHHAAEALDRIGTPEALEAVRMWREQQAGGGGEG